MLKWFLKNGTRGCPDATSCKGYNEPAAYIKGGEFLKEWCDCQLRFCSGVLVGSSLCTK
jgi:hypothetical protein